MEQREGKSESRLDLVPAVALVARTISDIDHLSTECRFALLDYLLSSAWPTRAAQVQ
jgi:hypothetical protein